MTEKTLYERLGGYDVIAAVVDNLLSRLMSDSQLERFWNNRGEETLSEKNSYWLITCVRMWAVHYYITGRDNKIPHKGMGISESNWGKFIGHLNATLDSFQVPQQEHSDVITFIESTHADVINY